MYPSSLHMPRFLIWTSSMVRPDGAERQSQHLLWGLQAASSQIHRYPTMALLSVQPLIFDALGGSTQYFSHPRFALLVIFHSRAFCLPQATWTWMFDIPACLIQYHPFLRFRLKILLLKDFVSQRRFRNMMEIFPTRPRSHVQPGENNNPSSIWPKATALPLSRARPNLFRIKTTIGVQRTLNRQLHS